MIEEKKEETAREKKNQKPRLFARIGAKRGVGSLPHTIVGPGRLTERPSGWGLL